MAGCLEARPSQLMDVDLSMITHKIEPQVSVGGHQELLNSSPVNINEVEDDIYDAKRL